MHTNRQTQTIADESDYDPRLFGFAKKRDFQEQNPPKTPEEFYATYDPSIGWGTGMFLCSAMLMLIIYCMIKFLYRRVEKWKDEGSWEKFFRQFSGKKLTFPIKNFSSDSPGSLNSTLKVTLIQTFEHAPTKKLSGTDIDINIIGATPCVTPLPPMKHFFGTTAEMKSGPGPSSATDKEELKPTLQSLCVPSRLKAVALKPQNTTQVEVHTYQSIVKLTNSSFTFESAI